MRIGIDMYGVQSPGSRLRGIGRYGHHLVAAMLAADRRNEYILYAHDGFPTDQVPAPPAGARARVAALGRDPGRGEYTLFAVMERLARTNPDALDLLLVLSPFEMYDDYSPPHKPLGGLRMASVVYDLIPFLFQEISLPDAYWAMRYYRHFQTLAKYDALLAISEATRVDLLSLAGLPADRVANIGAAIDPEFFRPDGAVPMPMESRRLLHRFGITRPYIFNLGSMEERKNLFGLIDAFRLLPAALRLRHQLVLGCKMTGAFIERLRRHAEDRGVAGQLVLTNQVSDAELRVLYQRCAAFAFPSLYEGFGLPILEAMQCGAAVVAGHNSAQVEVVGDAGLLANAHDPADIAAKLARLLADPLLAGRLGREARERARRFSWDITAAAALEAIGRAATPSPPARTPAGRPPSSAPATTGEAGTVPRRARPAPRPRLAVFSPWPPKGSGISDYAVRLIGRLGRRHAIDIYHEPGYVPDLGLGSCELGCHDYRLFERHAALVHYRAVLYQMGNSLYHKFVYETMLRHPGIVTLHDFSLAGFHEWYALQDGTEPGHFEREVGHSYGGRAPEILANLDPWAREAGGLKEACGRRGLYLNRRVFEHARAVVVHSPWCLGQVERLLPRFAARTVVIPMGATPRLPSPAQRAAIRDRFDLPRDALICASFGILHPNKMNLETIEAFEPLARSDPSALLLLVGQDWGLGESRRKAEQLGIAGQVRLLGRQTAADFDDLIAATDVGLSLRRPPTNGETSASLLDLLRMGVATVVTDVATFADYPDTVVRKVRWDRDGIDGLRRAIRDLAASRPEREALGLAAHAYVAERHDWDRSVALYERVIEHQAEPNGKRFRRDAGTPRIGRPHGPTGARPEAAGGPGAARGQASRTTKEV